MKFLLSNLVRVLSATRLVGDLQPDATTKSTFTTWKSYKSDSPLLASGLLGPVFVVKEARK
jgi:hypothetical protein